ncbi:MAG: hypothetical protein Q8K99_06095 [Actinomycetota bacterium]|nr:hypothetical protein [Actinomycetota bacterium]
MSDDTPTERRVAPQRAGEPEMPNRFPILPTLVFLVIGLLLGSFIPSPFRSANPTPPEQTADVRTLEAVVDTLKEQNWTLSRQRDALQDRVDADGADGKTTAPSLPEGTLGDGIYRVGEDVEPGTYDGTVVGEFGYWARLRATDGTVGSIIANGLPTGPFTLTINPSDEAIELRGVEITRR